jgi:homoserine O-acetyltransferase
MMGRGKAFDPSRFFIFCANVLGSPYGSASPITINPETGKPYGPTFPATTIRDDVWCVFERDRHELSLNFFLNFYPVIPFSVQKLVLDHLGVRSVAVVVGGSMGGMCALEYPLCMPPSYIRHVIPLATSARHSAWCISWGEAQRSSIYSDPNWKGGWYEKGQEPAAGLAAARMCALLTYRSRDSFETRFGRKTQLQIGSTIDQLVAKQHEQQGNGEATGNSIFSAQSYLHYQGNKFTGRFDANCYVHITHKMDTHDLARGRSPSSTHAQPEILASILSTLPPRALIISIQTDGLFTPSEQSLLASHIPEAELVVIESRDGHDGFLLEFEAINGVIMKFLKREFSEYYADSERDQVENDENAGDFEIKKTSLFGEAEKYITSW